MIVGISTVKDEEDVIVPVLRHMCSQVDMVLIADNLSTDSTFDLLMSLREEGLPVEVLVDHEVAYYQSRKMSALARVAAKKFEAQWVVPFDADEIWYSTQFPTLRDHLLSHSEDVGFIHAQLYDHVATGQDPDEPNPIARIGWRRLVGAELPKVAVRPIAHVNIHQGNHGAHYPSEHGGGLIVRHFPYRSVSQMVSKVRNGAAAYQATDLPESRGAHWRQYGMLLDGFGEEAIHDVFRKWFWVADPTQDRALIFDPAPAST